MAWDGIERRQTGHFCQQHIPLITDLTTIKTSVINIEKSLTAAQSFKSGIITTLVGMALVVVIQIATFAYLYGQALKQIEVNTCRLDKIERVMFK